MKVVQTRTPDDVTVDISDMPTYQTDAMCRTLLGCVSRLFEDPAVKADYERWKMEREKGVTHG